MTGALCRLLEALELLALVGCAASLGQGRAAGGLTCGAHRLGGACDALGIPLAEALRVEAVAIDLVDPDAHLVSERALELRGLVDRHLLGKRDDDDPRPLRVANEGVKRLGLLADRADLGDVGERPRRLQEADAVAGCGCVDDHQVVAVAAADLAVVESELPDLSDRHQLLEARGRRGQVVEDPRTKQQVAHRLDLQLQQYVLAHRLVGIDRDRPEVLDHLDLSEADLVALENVRQVLLGSDLAEDRPLAGPRGGQPERERDRGLAHAALAGHDDQPFVEEAHLERLRLLAALGCLVARRSANAAVALAAASVELVAALVAVEGRLTHPAPEHVTPSKPPSVTASAPVAPAGKAADAARSLITASIRRRPLTARIVLPHSACEAERSEAESRRR